MKKEVKINELQELVKEFLEKLKAFDNKATVVLLEGNLGSGKTTFVKEVAKQLGVKSEVTSPTFTLMQRLETKDSNLKTMVHIDLYRIEDEKEFEILKLEEIFKEPKTLVLIEWPEKASSLLSTLDSKISVKIDYNNEDSRIFEINYE